MAEYAVLLDLDDTLVVQREAFEEAGLRLEFLRGMDTRTKTFQAPEDSHNLLVLGVREGGHA